MIDLNAFIGDCDETDALIFKTGSPTLFLHWLRAKSCSRCFKMV